MAASPATSGSEAALETMTGQREPRDTEESGDILINVCVNLWHIQFLVSFSTLMSIELLPVVTSVTIFTSRYSSKGSL